MNLQQQQNCIRLSMCMVTECQPRQRELWQHFYGSELILAASCPFRINFPIGVFPRDVTLSRVCLGIWGQAFRVVCALSDYGMLFTLLLINMFGACCVYWFHEKAWFSKNVYNEISRQHYKWSGVELHFLNPIDIEVSLGLRCPIPDPSQMLWGFRGSKCQQKPGKLHNHGRILTHLTLANNQCRQFGSVVQVYYVPNMRSR